LCFHFPFPAHLPEWRPTFIREAARLVREKISRVWMQFQDISHSSYFSRKKNLAQSNKVRYTTS